RVATGRRQAHSAARRRNGGWYVEGTSRLRDPADAVEIGLETREAVAILAQQDEDEVEQMVQRALVQQRLDVRAIVVGGNEQGMVGMRAQRIGRVPGDGHDASAPLAELA